MRQNEFDLCTRLRAERVSAPPEHPVHPTICDEAADRIEELQRRCSYLQTTKRSDEDQLIAILKLCGLEHAETSVVDAVQNALALKRTSQK